MEDVKGLRERKSQDNVETSVKNSEELQQENNQDENKGTTSSADFKNNTVFEDVRKAIRAMVRCATENEQEYEDRSVIFTYAMAESALIDIDNMHKTALIAVRKAIEVEKAEGEKLKVELQKKWHVARWTFANATCDYDYDLDYGSDPDLNPHSDLWEGYEEDEEQDGVELKEWDAHLLTQNEEAKSSIERKGEGGSWSKHHDNLLSTENINLMRIMRLTILWNLHWSFMNGTIEPPLICTSFSVCRVPRSAGWLQCTYPRR